MNSAQKHAASDTLDLLSLNKSDIFLNKRKREENMTRDT